jgi:hypothetical protein
MTEAEIRGPSDPPLEEAKKTQETLKPLGYETIGFLCKRSFFYDFALHLRFVGTSVFAGNDDGRIPGDGKKGSVIQNPDNGFQGTE